jgi:YbbR domain-containing protein
MKETRLKALALVIAAALFVFVRAEGGTEITFDLPVVYRVPPDHVLVSSPPERVRVVVRGALSRLVHFDERDVDAPIVIDLAGVASGSLPVPAQLVRLPHGLRVAAITPATVPIELEPRVTRIVPIEASIAGRPAPGWTVSQVLVTPESVVVSGARNAVEQLRALTTTPVRIAEERGPVVQTVPLEPAPRAVEIANPPLVKVEVRFTPTRGEALAP